MHAAESVVAREVDPPLQTPEGHDTEPENDSSTSHVESEDSASTVIYQAASTGPVGGPVRGAQRKNRCLLFSLHLCCQL